jgi:hypothetical protein
MTNLELGSRVLANDHDVPGADLDVLVSTHRNDLCGLGLLLSRKVATQNLQANLATPFYHFARRF